MSEYNNLLQELRSKVIELQKPIIATALDYIPKMYKAILKENPKLTPIQARQIIEKDCSEEFWSKRTILSALPDEAKNLEKQKAGRLRHKNKIQNSAAIIAAAELQQQIDSKGKTIQNDRYLHSKVSDNIGFLDNRYIDNLDINSKFSLNEQLLDFEFCLKFREIRDYVAPFFNKAGDNGDIWFNGRINVKSGKVVEAKFGEIRDYVAPFFNKAGDNGDIWFNGRINVKSGKVVEAKFGRIKENE